MAKLCYMKSGSFIVYVKSEDLFPSDNLLRFHKNLLEEV